MANTEKEKKYLIVTAGIAIIILGILIWLGIQAGNEKEPEYVFFYADNQAEDYPTIFRRTCGRTNRWKNTYSCEG